MAVIRYRHTLYTPGDDVKGTLDALPRGAGKSIDVEIYGLTDTALIGEMIEAARRGVHVRVNNDRSQSAGSADKAALQMLVDAGLPNIEVRVTESERGAIDHLKLLILDGEDGAMANSSAVAYGSYNFSSNAALQDNVFVVTNDPGEVAQAMAKFDHDWTANKSLPQWQIQPSGKEQGDGKAKEPTPEA